MKLSVSLITTVCALTVLPAVASAQDQPWLKDRRYTEGIGYRVGDLELHPGLAGEFGYDSNYFHRSSDEEPVGSLRLRITPSFSLSTLSKQRREAAPGTAPPDFEFRAGLSATYNEFFPVSGPQEGKDAMSDQRNVGGLLNLNLLILPERPWSVALYGDLGRAITPSNDGITSASFNRLNTNAGGEVIWTPGGGLLDWRLGYRFSGTIFESSDFQRLTNLEHTVQTRGRWRFLPRTALMYDARLGFINYPSGVEKTSSHPLRTLLGVNGLVTNSFGILALAGWGASFYTPRPQEDFDSVIGQLEFKWYLTPNPSTEPLAATLALSAVSVGFRRDFVDAYIGTYYELDRGYLNMSYFFGGKFLAVVEGGVGAVVWPPSPGPGGLGTDPSTDIRIDGSVFGEYRIRDSIGINSTIRYGANLSDNEIQPAAGSTAGGDQLEWQDFEAYIGARWFM
jgi:hypothetical protein